MCRTAANAFPAVALGLAVALSSFVRADDAGPGDLFELGVQTHFAQGWRLEFLHLLPRLGTAALRDEVSWRDIEAAPGDYRFTGERLEFLPAALGLGIDALIVFTDTNPLYDDGMTPWTSTGREGLADYVVAVLDTYSPGIRRIEIGNEFNSDDFVSGPFADDRAASFVALLRDVHVAVKARHPDTQILCTGTHSVAIGFFRALFEEGALAHCDAISLHPYRDRPEHLGPEIARLRALMAEFGTVLPIYATEFGKWFDDPREAPDYMIRMVAIMGDAGVEAAWWYALLDQPWWPNMGLYDPDGTPLPAADAFGFLQQDLLPHGRPRMIGETPLDMVFEFGTAGQAFVVWGAPQGRLVVEGAAAFHDARGARIDRPAELSDTPVVILGRDLLVSVQRDRGMIDVGYGFGMPSWSYHSRRPDGSEAPLVHLDGNWSSVLGDPWLRPLLISPDWISGALFDTGPHHAIERFTAQVAGPHEVTGHWMRPVGDGREAGRDGESDGESDGADIVISHDGAVIAKGVAGDRPFIFGPVMIDLAMGDSLDFAVGPHREGGDDAVRREIRIVYPLLSGRVPED